MKHSFAELSRDHETVYPGGRMGWQTQCQHCHVQVKMGSGPTMTPKFLVNGKWTSTRPPCRKTSLIRTSHACR